MTRAGYSIKEISQIIKGEWVVKSATPFIIKDIVIDSRKLSSNETSIFFALVGKRNDGHRYLQDIYEKGIRNFVVSTLPVNLENFNESNFIVVKNTLIALQALAIAHRKKFDIPVIGITGSNGKTIIKEWLHQLLSVDKKIVKSPKSFNSQIGVPLSVWQMDPEHELAIFEAGISEPEEMTQLQTIIQPTVGIFTNIGQAHDENFINLQQKIAEKSKLFTKVDTLIYCSDYAEIQEQLVKTKILRNVTPFTWSRKTKADLTIEQVQKGQKSTTIEGIFKEKKIKIEIPFTDEGSIENAIHCWATLLFFEYENQIIAERMLLLAPIAMRLELKEGINNCSIINDSYNSDIKSLGIALDFLNQLKQHKKKTLILSDILQSGKEESELYEEVAKLIANKEINHIIGIGKAISRQSEKFKIEKDFFLTTNDFIQQYPFSSFNGEALLIKGARIFEFERISKILQQKDHETVLEINLNALVHNLNYYRSKIKPETKIMAMVKAFSYGSGSVEIANLLQFHRVDYLAVAYADEGVELRKAGITMPIMVMNPDEQSLDAIIKYNLEPEIYSFRILSLLEEAINKNLFSKDISIPIHIKLDTGMHRLGFEEADMQTLIDRIKTNNYIKIQSVFSHLAASDEPMHDEFTRKQIDCLSGMKKYFEKLNPSIIYHILNSAGITRFNDAQFDMVRLGIGLYGISSDEEEQKTLHNVNTLRSTIAQIKTISENETIGYNRKGIANREMKIGIVSIGYADGLSRSLGNGKGHLMVNDQLVLIIGNVCMDMCMIDITDIDAKEGDKVTVFGDDRPIHILSEELDTIPYEVLTGISRRVKRIYYQE